MKCLFHKWEDLYKRYRCERNRARDGAKIVVRETVGYIRELRQCERCGALERYVDPEKSATVHVCSSELPQVQYEVNRGRIVPERTLI